MPYFRMYNFHSTSFGSNFVLIKELTLVIEEQTGWTNDLCTPAVRDYSFRSIGENQSRKSLVFGCKKSDSIRLQDSLTRMFLICNGISGQFYSEISSNRQNNCWKATVDDSKNSCKNLAGSSRTQMHYACKILQDIFHAAPELSKETDFISFLQNYLCQ